MRDQSKKAQSVGEADFLTVGARPLFVIKPQFNLPCLHYFCGAYASLTFGAEKIFNYPLALLHRIVYNTLIFNSIGVLAMPSNSVSHNACSVIGRSISRVNVSYWLEIDRGDYPCTDIVGEFSIIDPSFQVDTYGTHLCSDRSLVRNYALRRCFVEFMQRFPSHLDGVPCSFAVLSSHFEVAPNRSSIYNCRCYFNPLKGEPIPSIDFRLSLGVECLGTTTNRKDTQK